MLNKWITSQIILKIQYKYLKLKLKDDITNLMLKLNKNNYVFEEKLECVDCDVKILNITHFKGHLQEAHSKLGRDYVWPILEQI